MDSNSVPFHKEPYRILFPMGILYLLWGTLIWLPQIWNPGSYPLLAHRFLMLNGFSSSFIAGFLMTAVPKFSSTEPAKISEVYSFIIVTFLGLYFAFIGMEPMVYTASAVQAGLILLFLGIRVTKRKANPPYSFVFIFAGLILWIVSSLMTVFTTSEAFKDLHYEGAVAAIILGVGSRLVPGILGHVEVVQTQRIRYENEKPFFLTVPLHFYGLMILFVGSYFIQNIVGDILRTLVVLSVAIFYWRLYLFPKERTALTWNIWIACWLIVGSFILKCAWREVGIHASHAFFFSGIVLLTLLIATRVLQSHGPKIKSLENLKILYLITFLITMAGATRVSAILMGDGYFRHLGYSAFVLTLSVLIWSIRYLKYVRVH